MTISKPAKPVILTVTELDTHFARGKINKADYRMTKEAAEKVEARKEGETK